MNNKQTILITGGNGFLGKNLAIRLKDEYNVILASRNNKRNWEAQQATGCKFVPMDLVNIESVRDAIRETRPDIIIHAGATKFVDLSEKFPNECIDINVIGSQNIARVAQEWGVPFVLGISTDKATPPIRNIYGLSKATMERLFCLSNVKDDTKFACVRYGNVVWSTGSVFPIWKKMSETTGIIETTGPNMRRFFFSVEDAVDLVYTAIKNQDKIAGKVLSLKMKAAQVKDILDVWIETSPVPLKWVAVNERPGERQDEYLVGETELEYSEQVKFGNKDYILISPNEKSSSPIAEIFGSHNAERLTKEEIAELIKNEPKIS